MPVLSIFRDGDNVYPDLKDKADRIIHVTTPWSVSRLKGGMKSGKSSVMIRIDLPDGRIVMAETSMELFQAAARAFKIADEQDYAELS